jgi:hypothetical protein
MEFIKHPLCTDSIGAPSDMNDGSCAALPVAYRKDEHGTWAVSFWKPGDGDLQYLLTGGGIALHVRASGRQHPVVAMGVWRDVQRNEDPLQPLPTVASLYPAQHPFPVAVRRVQELEAVLARSFVVDLEGLTSFTATTMGGMQPTDGFGPWLLKVDVQRSARHVHPDDVAIAVFGAQLASAMASGRMNGRGGWNNPNECSIEKLASLLVNNVWSGDIIDIGNYAMMLHYRGADRSAIPLALKYLIDQQIKLHDNRKRSQVFSAYGPETAETFAQALVAKGWHNDDINCVDGLDELLSAFLSKHVGEVSA